MNLAEYFTSGGLGVMATAGNGGAVNTAVYAVPHVIDEETVAWGMTEGRTYRFAKENPHAAYLYFASGAAMKGVRLTLMLKEIETSGTLLETVRARATGTAGAKAAAAVKYVACYKVVETRPLV